MSPGPARLPSPALNQNCSMGSLVLTNPKTDVLSDPATPACVSHAFSATHATAAAILDHGADTTPGTLDPSSVAENTAYNTLDCTSSATHSDVVVVTLVSSLADCEVALLTETKDCFSPTGDTITSGPLDTLETRPCFFPANLPESPLGLSPCPNSLTAGPAQSPSQSPVITPEPDCNNGIMTREDGKASGGGSNSEMAEFKAEMA